MHSLKEDQFQAVLTNMKLAKFDQLTKTTSAYSVIFVKQVIKLNFKMNNSIQ